MCSYFPKEIVASYLPDSKIAIEYKKVDLQNGETKIIKKKREMTDEELNRYKNDVEYAKAYTKKLAEDFMSHLKDFK